MTRVVYDGTQAWIARNNMAEQTAAAINAFGQQFTPQGRLATAVAEDKMAQLRADQEAIEAQYGTSWTPPVSAPAPATPLNMGGPLGAAPAPAGGMPVPDGGVAATSPVAPPAPIETRGLSGSVAPQEKIFPRQTEEAVKPSLKVIGESPENPGAYLVEIDKRTFVKQGNATTERQQLLQQKIEEAEAEVAQKLAAIGRTNDPRARAQIAEKIGSVKKELAQARADAIAYQEVVGKEAATAIAKFRHNPEQLSAALSQLGMNVTLVANEHDPGGMLAYYEGAEQWQIVPSSFLTSIEEKFTTRNTTIDPKTGQSVTTVTGPRGSWQDGDGHVIGLQKQFALEQDKEQSEIARNNALTAHYQRDPTPQKQSQTEALKGKAEAMAVVYLNADKTGTMTYEQALKHAWQVLARDPELTQKPDMNVPPEEMKAFYAQLATIDPKDDVALGSLARMFPRAFAAAYGAGGGLKAGPRTGKAEAGKSNAPPPEPLTLKPPPGVVMEHKPVRTPPPGVYQGGAYKGTF